MKRLLSLLLCLALALSLCACGGTVDSSSPGSSGAGVSEDPGPSPMELALETYRAATDALSAMPELTAALTISHTTTINGNQFEESTRLTLSLKGLDTESPLIYAEGTSQWGGVHTISRSESYGDGRMYGRIDDFKYTGPIEAEQFLAGYPALPLIDADLYSSVEQVRTDALQFSGAGAVEGWLAGPEAEVQEANGTVTLDESGAITESRYTVTYTEGGILHEVSVIASLSPDCGEITLPEESEEYVPFDSPEALLLIERSYGHLLQAEDMTAGITESYMVDAGSLAITKQSNLDYLDLRGDPLLQVSLTQQHIDYSSGRTESYSETDRYENGVFTYTVDGQESTDSSTSANDILYYAMGVVAGYYPPPEHLASCTLTELEGLYLVEYELTEEFGAGMCATLSYDLWADENFFDAYASAYRTEGVSGYLGIDAATGLPTAIALSYAGYHTIDGDEYLFGYSNNTSLFAASTTAYETITGELPQVQADSPSPLFYHVTGSNGEELWLLGTIHVGDPRTTALPQEIWAAFDASDALAVEFDTNAFAEQMTSDPELALQIAQLYYYTDGTTVTDHLSDETLKEYMMDYARASGMYAPGVELMKPSLWSSMFDSFLLQQSYTLSASYGVDSQLLKRAEEDGKQILDVESGMEQLEMLANYSDEIQEMLLGSSLSYTPLGYGIGVTELYEAWCAGDEAAISAMLTSETEGMTEEELALYEEYNNAMMVQRNEKMLQVALDYLSGGDTVFYAVGLAHLIAEDGLIHTLEDAGYTVERVHLTE